ncbi:MAG: 4-hydroxy-tetrahydrodipicolinate reductase [Bacteroidota bacterium]|jgi:4-hydroxy-tetrahydrodipicolinate reductase
MSGLVLACAFIDLYYFYQMNIALLGYGKMGKAIEQIALERGHQIVARINSETPLTSVQWSTVDVCIEFTQPQLALQHIQFCAEKQVPIVVGTTAWLSGLEQAKASIALHDSALLHASNFSVGVNIFFALNQKLAELMANYPAYKVSLEETHHVQKLDAPSGTAVTLLEDLLETLKPYNSWSLDPNSSKQIPVVAHRIPDVPGTHEVRYDSEIDTIRIEHIAHNRKGFALGAVLAAEFLKGRKGYYQMSDVLNF